MLGFKSRSYEQLSGILINQLLINKPHTTPQRYQPLLSEYEFNFLLVEASKKNDKRVLEAARLYQPDLMYQFFYSRQTNIDKVVSEEQREYAKSILLIPIEELEHRFLSTAISNKDWEYSRSEKSETSNNEKCTDWPVKSEKSFTCYFKYFRNQLLPLVANNLSEERSEFKTEKDRTTFSI